MEYFVCVLIFSALIIEQFYSTVQTSLSCENFVIPKSQRRIPNSVVDYCVYFCDIYPIVQVLFKKILVSAYIYVAKLCKSLEFLQCLLID